MDVANADQTQQKLTRTPPAGAGGIGVTRFTPTCYDMLDISRPKL
jgi:hypothetical protein